MKALDFIEKHLKPDVVVVEVNHQLINALKFNRDIHIEQDKDIINAQYMGRTLLKMRNCKT